MSGRVVAKSLVALMLLAVAALAAGFYVLRLVLSDDLAFRQGDLAYAIVTSETIRAFPRFSAIGDDVDFRYSARDGTAPAEIEMTYHSPDSVDDLLRKYSAYCELQEYAAVPEDEHFLPSRLACDAADHRIEVDFRVPGPDATLVSVTFLEKSSASTSARQTARVP